MKTKDGLETSSELLEKHKGKRVVTGWVLAGNWSWVGFKKGARGTVIGWGTDGPMLRVDGGTGPKDNLFPGGNSSNKWGEGRTWKFEKGQ